MTDAKFEGKMNEAKTEAKGTWTQRGAFSCGGLSCEEGQGHAAAEGHWQRADLGGQAEDAGAGLQLRLVLHVQKTEGGGLRGKLDSPLTRGQRGCTSTRSRSTMQNSLSSEVNRRTFEGKLSADGEGGCREFHPRRAKLPLTFKQTDKVTELLRPQTPKPPFPYKAVELLYGNEPAGIELAGTLTVPEGPGPFPAVILISGSVAQDRDETIFEHKPFHVLADTLSRRRNRRASC